MIHIHEENCIGCGRCAWDCFPGVLTMENQKPQITYPDRCLSCGHCIAICPKNAVYDDELNMEDSVLVAREKAPELLLSSMRSRRSCRHFTGAPISEEDLNMLLEAARACPTARNLQATRYIAVRESISPLLDAALEGLGQVGQAQLESAKDPNEIRRAENFISWAKLRQNNKDFDPLFFHAPLLLMFVAEGDPRDAAAAASYTELMAWHLGLGCLYSGYFTACAAGSPKIKEMLGLKDSEAVVRCLVLGHPDIKFLHTAPRRVPDVKYM